MEDETTTDAILEEISELNPTGRDLHETEELQLLYFDLRDIRKSTAKNLSEMASPDEADDFNSSWHEISKQSIKILTQHSKDLEVVAWLIEAWTSLEGFAGLSRGLAILTDLICKYGNSLHPCSDGDESYVGETMLSPINLLNGKVGMGILILAINLSPLVHLTTGEIINNWSLTQHANKANSDTSPDYLDDLAGKIDHLQLGATLASIDDVVSEITRLEDTLTDKFSSETPSLLNLRGTIEECRRNLVKLQPEQQPDEETNPVQEQLNTSPLSNSALNHTNVNRDEALNAIKLALDYYKINEPHSPINYLLKRATDWHNKELSEILGEIIINEDAKADLFRLFGIQQNYTAQELMGHEHIEGY